MSLPPLHNLTVSVEEENVCLVLDWEDYQRCSRFTVIWLDEEFDSYAKPSQKIKNLC